MFPSMVASVFLAASAFVRASPMVPRDNSGSCVSGLIDKLDQLGMTISADQLEKAIAAPGGDYICYLLESQDVSLFLPQDAAYDSSNPSIGDDPLSIISYSIVFGTPEDGFKVTNTSLTRRGASQSRSSGSSGLNWPGRSSRKRWNGLLDNNQVQIIDQLSSSSKKRNDGPIIIIDRPVGSALVLQRSQWNNVGIFETDRLFTLPPPPSDLLSKPLISEAPKGFTQFGGALQKAGLLDDIDNSFKSTVLAPTDEAFDEANIPKNQMASVLKNHFFFGTIIYSTIFTKIPEATAESGKKLKFSYRDGVHYVSCGKDVAIILRSDVTSKWGVLHVINKVLKCDD